MPDHQHFAHSNYPQFIPAQSIYVDPSTRHLCTEHLPTVDSSNWCCPEEGSDETDLPCVACQACIGLCAWVEGVGCACACDEGGGEGPKGN
jgi:hypothetical protein